MPRLRGGQRHGFVFAGHVDDRLGGNAATDEAGAAKAISFDERGVEPPLAGPDRGDVSSWASSCYGNFGVDGFGHDLSSVVTNGTRVAFLDLRLQRSAASDNTDGFSSVRVLDRRTDMLGILKYFPVVILVVHQNIVCRFDPIVSNASDRFV